MTIIDRLREMVPDDAQICDVVVGIFWTYVRTQYGVAVSATAHRWVEDPPGAIIPWAGELIGKRVRDVADLYASESLTARSLANAAISASFPASAMTGCEIQGRGQDLLHTFCNKSNDLCHIALIGHFHFADELARLGHDLDIYELDPRCTQGEIPSSQIPQRLPQADIVVMTSSTIITHSTEGILAAARPDAIKMIVGPTVPDLMRYVPRSSTIRSKFASLQRKVAITSKWSGRGRSISSIRSRRICLCRVGEWP